MNYSKKRGEEYRTVSPSAALKPWATKDRSGRKDNLQLAARVRGKVYTGAAKKADRPEAVVDKTAMFQKPACGHLDSEKFLRRRKRPEEELETSRLKMPNDASREEREKIQRWLEQADEISRAQRR